jgi:putative CocE/NonD family hydrolase
MTRRHLLGLLGFTVACAAPVKTANQPGTDTTVEPRDDADAATDPEEAKKAALAAYVHEHYLKREVQIPMRDGVKLFTAIYTPRDATAEHPFLMIRTPYSVRPYGPDEYRDSLGPSEELMKDGYIFVYQDVRGRMMSEGTFTNMTPHIAKKESKAEVDESTDTHDTVAWLLENVEGHNGKVGQWGISYPGFYAAAGMIDHHPALVAVSPQAPIADWWYDDFHHHGAFFLPHAVNFLYSFGRPRPEPTTERNPRMEHGTPDGFQFFQELGPLKNVDEKWYRGDVPFWNDIVAHPNYDGYWQARNLLPHLKNVSPAVMTVGGWFDAEDLYGPLQIYREVRKNNPEVFNMLVMGPWRHGGWSRSDGDSLGNVHFGAKTSQLYRTEIERTFFNHFLKGEGHNELPGAYVFETGKNRWRTFDAWPPENLSRRWLYADDGGSLAFDSKPGKGARYDEFVSDPARPVPFAEDVATGMTREYMTDDQRFAARRQDVLVFETPILTEDVTLAGPIDAELWVSTSRRDADWIVKVVDVFPPGAEDHDALRRGMHMGNYHMMVRSEVIRGRFRESPSEPKPFGPNKVTRVDLPLQDVLHTFQSGHRIQIQIQSTWFPLVDLNPQRWVDNIFEADPEDFAAATHRVFHEPAHATRFGVTTLPAR